MYDFSTYFPEPDGTDSTFSIPPFKENGYLVVTNKQKVLNFIPVDLFAVKSPEIRVMSLEINSDICVFLELDICIGVPDTAESTFFD